MATPYVLIRLDSTESTQDIARVRFDGRPLLVVAGTQTRGRGRSGRPWQSAPRALAASLAFRAGWPTHAWGALPLAAGLAAREALDPGLALKWPNDLYREGRKVAGILIEGDGETAVAGLGANLWWPSAPEGTGALFEEDPGPDRAGELAGDFAVGLLERLAAGPQRWGLAEYRGACLTLGRTVRWDPDGEGRASDVDPSGALVVETAGGRRLLHSAEVREVRPVLPSGPPWSEEAAGDEHPAR